jgi:hypothetical protein
MWKRSVIAILPILLSACGTKQAQTDLVMFPAPPDTPRIQFLTRFSDSGDVGGGSSLLRTVVGESETARDINKPYGIAVHGGKIYVCDTGYATVDILDLENHKFEYFRPTGFGTLREPINCFVDKEDGWLYVADIVRRQVVVFDSDGQYWSSFGEREGIRPTDVFVGTYRIWVSDVADAPNGKIRVYNKQNFELMATIAGSEADSASQLAYPTNLYVTADRVYVTDFGSFTVKVFSRQGDFLSTIGSFGRDLGQFVRPKGIAVDREGIVYVVDAAFQNVQMFDSEGRLLMFFGGGYQGPGYMSLPAKVIIDYDNLGYFEQFVHESYDLKHLIFVTNQFGPDKVNVYGFVEPAKGADGAN